MLIKYVRYNITNITTSLVLCSTPTISFYLPLKNKLLKVGRVVARISLWAGKVTDCKLSVMFVGCSEVAEITRHLHRNKLFP